MIKGKKILAIIPARGGSKGIPRKNILEVNGKPLIAWTIEQAKKSRYIDRLILSSEDQEIITIAKKWECEVPFVRPQILATDEAIGVNVILHAMATINNHYDYIVVLQPTSPLRSHADIDTCIDICHSQKAPACVSVTEAEKNPFWMYFLDKNNVMRPILDIADRPTRRQDLPAAFALNGAVYVAEWDWFLKSKQFVSSQTVAYIMPQERSLDIDTHIDFNFFQYIAGLSQPKNING